MSDKVTKNSNALTLAYSSRHNHLKQQNITYIRKKQNKKSLITEEYYDQHKTIVKTSQYNHQFVDHFL